MEDREKMALRESRVYIRDYLILEEIWDPLVASNIFTPVMIEIIQSQDNRVQKVRQLMQDLERRPRPSFTKFLDILDSTGHEHCANFIRARAGLSISESRDSSRSSEAPDILRPSNGRSVGPGLPGTIPTASVCPTRAVNPEADDIPAFMEM